MSSNTGAVTFIQRFGGAVNLNVHFHMLFLDDVFVGNTFKESYAPSTESIDKLTHTIATRIGAYGEMFPDSEIPKYALSEQFTPDIEALTDIDYLFPEVSNWVAPNSASSVFPRLTQSGLPPDQRPILEDGIVFNNLFT